jgi:hypothetical protein
VQEGRRLLEAVEDLDFAARVQSGRGDRSPGESFETLFPPLRLALLERAAASDVTLTISARAGADRLAIGRDLAERLLRRFLFSVVEAADAGERLEIVVDRIGGRLAVAIDRPEVVRGLSEEQLVEPTVRAESAALGLGFALRLIRGLAGIAGGSLDLAPERLVLLLPLERG